MEQPRAGREGWRMVMRMRTAWYPRELAWGKQNKGKVPHGSHASIRGTGGGINSEGKGKHGIIPYNRTGRNYKQNDTLSPTSKPLPV